MEGVLAFLFGYLPTQVEPRARHMYAICEFTTSFDNREYYEKHSHIKDVKEIW